MVAVGPGSALLAREYREMGACLFALVPVAVMTRNARLEPEEGLAVRGRAACVGALRGVIRQSLAPDRGAVAIPEGAAGPIPSPSAKPEPDREVVRLRCFRASCDPPWAVMLGRRKRPDTPGWSHARRLVGNTGRRGILVARAHRSRGSGMAQRAEMRRQTTEAVWRRFLCSWARHAVSGRDRGQVRAPHLVLANDELAHTGIRSAEEPQRALPVGSTADRGSSRTVAVVDRAVAQFRLAKDG